MRDIMISKQKHFNLIPLFLTVISFVVFTIIILGYTQFNHEKTEKEIRSNLYDLLISKKSQLEKALYSRVYYTKGVAAYCAINNGITNDKFYQLTDELIKNDTVISTMALSKDCIIGALYPLEGHEAAIGVNLLEHPGRKRIVEKTIATQNTFIAGPVELVEGGIAFISYTPIFTIIKENKNNFWGVTDIVILQDKLFNEIKLQTQDEFYKFALKGVDGTGNNGACFWGDSLIFKQKPVTVKVLLPTGYWVLAGSPIIGWESNTDQNGLITRLLYISAFIISILIGLLTSAFIKIRRSQVELKALFGSMKDIIIEFDKIGTYVKIAPTNDGLLILPPEKLVNKTLYEVFDKKTADFFFNAINECFSTKKTVIIDYPLEINGQAFWFIARLTYLNDNSVLYVAHDNTTKKIAEDRLIESENYLKELNETKDKFFAIIAHDLRSPFQGFLGLSEILAKNSDDLAKEEIKEYSSELYKALEKQYELLDDLLNWAKVTKKNFNLSKSFINLHHTVNTVFEQVEVIAKIKNLNLINEINKGINLEVDEILFKVVLRNLISNSLKFSNINGFIKVSAKLIDNNYEISVSDNGVGMSPENIKKLFDNSNFSTAGTASEVGTGLGFNLSKEIVLKHNGKIYAESTLEKGTMISFTIPK